MPYTNPDTMAEIANILEDFDETTLVEIFKGQIIDNDDMFTSLPVNQFQPLFISYKSAMNTQDVEEDDIELIQDRFKRICINIIDLICVKYGIEIEDGWLEEHNSRLPSVTLSLYQFFVLDIFYVFLEILNNYIIKNMDSLSNTFADSIQQKDSSAITNLNIMDPKYAVLASSMYDVTDYIFTLMDTEQVFEYIDSSYIPGAILKSLFNDNILTGDIANTFGSIYKENISLRSKIVFELIYQIKKVGSLQYNGITNRTVEINTEEILSDEENEDPTAKKEPNTDIEDDNG